MLYDDSVPSTETTDPDTVVPACVVVKSLLSTPLTGSLNVTVNSTVSALVGLSLVVREIDSTSGASSTITLTARVSVTMPGFVSSTATSNESFPWKLSSGAYLGEVESW